MSEDEQFNSNCITPGTEFMDKLQKQLEFFITKKVSTDSLWKHTEVILSGHQVIQTNICWLDNLFNTLFWQVPGEGEHKIMEYIRFIRTEPGYDAETRHCILGLDADLMILGLCSHEPYFSLLREQVSIPIFNFFFWKNNLFKNKSFSLHCNR